MSASALVRSFDDLHFCDFILASVLVKSHAAASFFQSGDELVKAFIVELSCLSKVEPHVYDLDLRCI